MEFMIINILKLFIHTSIVICYNWKILSPLQILLAFSPLVTSLLAAILRFFTQFSSHISQPCTIEYYTRAWRGCSMHHCVVQDFFVFFCKVIFNASDTLPQKKVNITVHYSFTTYNVSINNILGIIYFYKFRVYKRVKFFLINYEIA